MTNNANQVVAGKPLVTGGALCAAIGTSLPTDEASVLNPAFKAVGYVGENGVTKSEKRDSEAKKAWGGDTVKVLQKSTEVTIKLTLAEFLSDIAQKAIYGDANVTTTAATTTKGTKMKVQITSSPAPRKAWVFEILSDTAKVRVVVPDAQVTDIGDVTFKDDDIATNEVTLTCFPDASGVYVYIYSEDGVKAVS